ncbi:MAG: cellulase family glycosylhydrolase [Chloroherpetonaceae bacterium]|nr:cellulase family glycosylhydrolase [Chthonomonadaceae bacterium]MDW8206376.1 cellulase family glycosylhydrolase [Chloroherpetonaceae bacterium]
MFSRSLTVLLTVVTLFLLSAPLQAQYRTRFPLPAGDATDSLGVNIHFTDPQPGEMERLAAAGFRWIRMDFAWDQIERQKGVYDFTAYDRLLQALEPHGIRALFILDYGNALYQPGAPSTPEARAAFVRFVTAAVQRFRGRGILWEMWNEPNLAQFWQPSPNPDDYAALAEAVGRAIRATAPEEWYIGPAVSGMDFAFLEKCFQKGLLRYWDAVSVHPYRSMAPETVLPDYLRLRTLIDRYAPGGKQIPIISGEWGYSELYAGLDIEKQARYIVRQALTNLQAGIRVSIWYDWKDDGTDPKEPEHHFGTVFPDLRPKPAYRAFQTLCQTLQGFRFNKRLALDAPEDFCLLFRKGDEVRLVVWTTARSPRTVRLPTRMDRFLLIGPQGEPEAGAGDGQTVTLTDAPRYIVPQGTSAALRDAVLWPALPLQIVLDPDTPLLARSPLFAPLNDARSPLRRAGARIIVQNLSAGPVPLQVATATVSQDRGAALRLTTDRWAQETADRSEAPRRFRVILQLPDREPLVQETQVISAAPLRLTLLPALAGTLAAEIENPGRRPFSGALVVRVQDRSFQQQVTLKADEISRRVTFSLPEPLPREYRIAAQLTAARTPFPALAIAPLRVRVLDDFTLFPAGSELPADSYRLLKDGDPKVHAAIRAEIQKPPEGLPLTEIGALRVTYEFAPGWKFFRLAPQDRQAEPLPDHPVAFGCWVYGDGSGNFLRIRFTDRTGQTFQPDYGPIDWKGWRYVTFPLDGQKSGHWGGADDGTVHYPIRLDTVLLVDSAGGRGGRGEVWVTGFTVTYRTP